MIVGVLGSGAWGRALATLVAEAGHQPRLGYRGRPPGGFPGSPNLAALTAESELVLVAVPPQSVREVIRTARPGPQSRVVIATRGLEPEAGTWLSEVVTQESTALRVGALAGPALAAEVIKRRPSALVVASAFDEVCTRTQQALHSVLCRVYTSHDLRGVELAGALVQVLSAVIGIADGLDLGVGVRGVVVSRGLAEGARLGAALGANPLTLSGLSGVGDLMSSASHPDSPTYAAGLRIGRTGRPDPEIARLAGALLALAGGQKVRLPLTEAVAAIALGKLQPRLAIDALMRREATAE